MGESREMRQRIVDAAIDLFSAQGFDSTSMREIAEKVGVTKPALYHHFASKDALLTVAIEPLNQAIQELIADADETSLPPGALLERYFDTVLEHKALAIWLSGDFSTRRPAIAERGWKQQARLIELLRGGDTSFERGVRVACSLGAVQVGILTFATMGGLERARDEILSSALSILKESS